MNTPRPLVRCVIFDARNFAALTVADLPAHIHDHLLNFDSPVQIRVDPILPMDIPVSPVDYAKQHYKLHVVSLRGVLFRIGERRRFTLIVTDTPDTAVLLDPVLLPGQRRRSDDELYEAGFEAGRRETLRRMSEPPPR